MAKKKAVKKMSKKSVKKTSAKAKRPTKKAPKAKKKASKPAKKKVSLLSRIAAAQEELEKARRKSEREGEKFFKEAVKEIFKEFPKLKSFSWEEYTPHWNDGDECVFSVYFETLVVNEENSPESLWELQSLHELLSNKDEEKLRIERELADFKGKDDDWKVKQLKSQLRDIAERDPVDIAEKYKMKKTITDLLEGIPTDTYQKMFGEGRVVVRRNGASAVEECEHD